MAKPRIGEPMPAFTLPGPDGEPVALPSLLGRGPVVIYFYPKDETLGCTREACSFRDRHEELVAAGAQVVGISPDPPDSHKAFAANHNLPFLLLSDVDKRVFQQLDVSTMFGVLTGRETFVLDRDGIVRHHVAGLLDPSRHVRESLAVVKRLVSGANAATSAVS